MGFRGQETLGSVSPQLYGDIYHVHLLVNDTGSDAIAQSIQLIAGRTAQEYNQRKGRQGAFWEDRYHATAIEADEHLHRCLIYIDLNMVRAGVVSHPAEWAHSGYREIQEPLKALRGHRSRGVSGVVRLYGSERFSKSTPPTG